MPSQQTEFGNDQENHPSSLFTLPQPYPTDEIERLSHNTDTAELYHKHGGPVSIEFAAVAGQEVMGTAGLINDQHAVHSFLDHVTGAPVIMSGGGMNSPLGNGLVYGTLTSADLYEDTVKVDVDQHFALNGTPRDQTRTYALGAYRISLPKTQVDCENFITVLNQYIHNEIEHLIPRRQKHHERIQKAHETLDHIRPGHVISVPPYETPVTVRSDQFKTYVVIPRRSSQDKTIPVTGFTVNNPRGGYYQIGYRKVESKHDPKKITCYISSSNSTPPQPNTSFRHTETFAGTDISIEDQTNLDESDLVHPDESILESPLPHPAVQTSITDVDGVGSTLYSKLFQHTSSGYSLTAEQIAHTLYNVRDFADQDYQAVNQILPSNVKTTLESYTPDVDSADN